MLLNKGPSKVKAASVALTRMFVLNRSLFPSRCLNWSTPDNGLSYCEPKAEVDKVTSLIKATFNNPTGPPALPCVAK